MVTESSRTIRASDDDLAYQRGILPGVSRTFALTIPVLAGSARGRDDERVSAVPHRGHDRGRPRVSTHEQKSEFHARFVAVVKGDASARDVRGAISRRCCPIESLPAEHDLVRNTAAVIRVTHALLGGRARGAHALRRASCAAGMPEFQRNKSLRGLADLDELAEYCYYVAGVVGEMCTELFCLHCPELAPKRDVMMRLAVSFGQGLQMTNILKDIWDDRQSGACWLPRSVFASGTLDLEQLESLAHAAGVSRRA